MIKEVSGSELTDIVVKRYRISMLTAFGIG